MNDLNQFLTAAVSEISSLHHRLDELSQQLISIKAELASFKKPIGRDEPQDFAAGILDDEEEQQVEAAATNGDSHHIAAATAIKPKTAISGIIPIARPSRPETVRVAGGIVPIAQEPVRRFDPTPPSNTPAGTVIHPDDDPDANAQRRPFIKWLPTTDTELPMIESRCRLKAEACRWADQRRKLMHQGQDFRADVEPKDRDLIWQAKQLPDCFLWMSHSTSPNPTEPYAWVILAGCFDVLADAVALIRRILEDHDDASEFFERGVDLVAEAQSALRICVTRIEGPPTDHDQARVFGWLKSVAMDRQIFIRRFMRLDDPADPDRWLDLKNRITAYEHTWESGHKKTLNRKKVLGKIKHKLTQIPTESAGCEAAWLAVAQDVDLLVADGLPPSSVELRDLLIENVEELPEMAAMPKGFQLTLREIDRYLSELPDPDQTEAPEEGVSPYVTEAAGLLAGKSAIIIGGDRRPHAAAAIEKAFQLSELIWIDTRAHESVSGFEPYVARPEVVMVLLAIRWSSHSYGEVQDFCRHYGKPLVRLPGGYNPNQIAAQIHEQCSGRLEESTPSIG
jgi:hypothetical protein